MFNAAVGVVKALVKEKMELLVVGRHLGWKTPAGMGKEANRRFQATPNALLIEKLSCLCEEQGILILLQEES